MSRRRIRIGVIGAGNIATLAHIPGLLRTGVADVVAICDRDRDRASSAASRFGIAGVYDDYARMFREASLDAVTVATPPVEHAPVTLAAVSAGLHVLCEKPLATSVSDAEMMVDKADQAGVVLAMNMHFRVLRESLALKAAVDAGRLGKLGYVHIRYLRNDFFPPSGSWVTIPGVSGGGALADMGPHLIDLALWLSGADGVSSVDALRRSTDRTVESGPTGLPAPGEDFASVRMQTNDGVTAIVECSWGYFGPDESRIQLIGDRGGADVVAGRGPSGSLRYYARSLNGHIEAIPAWPATTDGPDLVSFAVATQGSPSRGPRTGRSRRSRLWYRSMASFVAAAHGDAPPIATGRDGLAVQRVLEAAYRSPLT